MNLFDIACNRRYPDKPIILFLNKKDLFEEKAIRVDLNTCFSDYSGGLDVKNALQFIKNKYLEQNNTKRKIYTFATCATDTNNVKLVFRACSDIILKENLKVSGMYTIGSTENNVDADGLMV